MKAKQLCLLLLPFVVITIVRGQSDDDFSDPLEINNQYPSDHKPAPDDGDDGSGYGAIQSLDENNEPSSTTTEQAPLEDVDGGSQLLVNQSNKDNDQLSCPTNCQCNVEGEDFVTNCAELELTKMPSDIDSRTTKLKLQNNKLTEIPKEISALTKLKELNASGNEIKDLALGSISTLSELIVLDLKNNKLREYPMDLKNSFGSTKLKILNLGGNDIRVLLEPDVLGKFTSLEQIVVPKDAYNAQVEAGLCKNLASTLKLICVDTCDNEMSCQYFLEEPDDGVISAVISSISDDENEDDSLLHDLHEMNNTQDKATESLDNEKPAENESQSGTDSLNNGINATEITTEVSATDSAKVAEASAISRLNTLVQTVNSDESVNVGKLNIPAETTQTKDEATSTDTKESSNYKIGATTSDSKTGGVDKSVIGIIVAGMVVVVAGITIKKNWTSIKRRFSSNSRTPDRPAGNANGTTAPEEVPLQDKSPV